MFAAGSLLAQKRPSNTNALEAFKARQRMDEPRHGCADEWYMYRIHGIGRGRGG